MPLLVTSGLGRSSSGGGTVSALALEAYRTRIVLTAEFDLEITGAAATPDGYQIEPVAGGKNIGIHRVRVDGKSVIIYTDTQQLGVDYLLLLPWSIASATHIPVGPYSFIYQVNSFDLASIQNVLVIDARVVEVVFDMPVQDVDASDVSKYAFTPPLTVKGATKVSDWTYRLSTSRQAEGTTYQLAISDIRGQ